VHLLYLAALARVFCPGRPGIRRQDQRHHRDHRRGGASGVTLGGVGAFEHGYLPAATVTATAMTTAMTAVMGGGDGRREY
jgi:hypothetical protein